MIIITKGITTHKTKWYNDKADSYATLGLREHKLPRKVWTRVHGRIRLAGILQPMLGEIYARRMALDAER